MNILVSGQFGPVNIVMDNLAARLLCLGYRTDPLLRGAVINMQPKAQCQRGI